MKATTLTGREFSQDPRRARKAAERGPVFITDRGRPAHVLMSIREYRRLTEEPRRFIDMMGLPEGTEDAAIEIPSLDDPARPADFS